MCSNTSDTSCDTLYRIVERALTLGERLSGSRGCTFAIAEQSAARLHRWSTVTGRADSERFARRLRFDGLTRDAALHALGDVSVSRSSPLPDWALFLERALTASPLSERDRVFAVAAPVPFERILGRFIHTARTEVPTRAGDATCCFSEQAFVRLERVLLRRLCELAQPSLAASLDPVAREYDDDTIIAFFEEHATLARLAATCALHWVDATAELIRRVADDALALGDEFNSGRALGIVADVRGGLSDPHRRGRTVSILRFAGGATIVYKPRSLALERAFFELIEWLVPRSQEPRLTALRVVDRSEYGWMEFASPGDCATDDEVARYFERGGMLLCLMHTLGGSDIHQENILARGEHPLAIDLEALAGPSIGAQGIDGDVDPVPWSFVLESPLATGMLPVLRSRYDGIAESSGGLTTAAAGSATRYTNVPTLRGEIVRDDHPHAVQSGYARMYRTLLAHRDELLAHAGVLAPLAVARTRVVFRPTRVYMALLERATAPRLMRAGVDRSIEMQTLFQPFTKYEQRHRLWPALASEIDALEQLDIPIFEADVSASELLTSRGSVNGYIRTPGYDRVLARVRAMSDADLDRHLNYIRLAYTGHHQRRLRRGVREPSLTDAALDAADLLGRSAVDDGDGGVTWYALGGGASAGDLREVDLSLGSGRAGIALFFAAAWREFGDKHQRRMALAALAPLLARAHRTSASPDEPLSISRGVGGASYALVKAGELLEEPGLLHAGERLAEGITASRIANENDLTVWNGLSGAMLSLLAVHDATGSADALARATMCGRRILSARAADPATGLRAWPTADGDFVSGFAHGASGIGHALLTLHHRLPLSALRNAAEESSELEATLSHAPGPLGGWARGTVGVGLSRLAHVADNDTLRSRADASAAIDAASFAASGPLDKPDHLWSGNLGQADLLMTAGIQLGRPELKAQARDLAGRVVSRGKRRATYGDGMMEAALTPGLFDGLAGIGYELLRLHNPSMIPSVLLFG